MPAWPVVPHSPSVPPLRIGLLTLATDYGTETELAHLLNRWLAFPTSGALPAAVLSIARLPVAEQLTPETLVGVAAGIQTAAASIFPYDCEQRKTLDVCIFGCTSASLAIGEDRVARLLTESKPARAIVQVATAVREAIGRLGARRVAVLTPYVASVNESVDAFLESMQLEVVARASFGCPTDFDTNLIRPDTVEAAGLALVRSAAVLPEMLFISCTGLMMCSRLQTMEAALGIPVVSSNSATAWKVAAELRRLAEADGRPAPAGALGDEFGRLGAREGRVAV